MSDGTASSLSSLSADLREFAETYRSGGLAALPNAANILDDISSLVESGKATRSTLDEAYQKLTDAVWKDFLAAAGGKAVLDDIDAILSRPSRTTLDALKAMLSSDKALHTCAEIIALSIRVADREANVEVVTHLLCFVYLLLLEGSYRSTLRFLYAHYLGRPYKRTKIVDMKKRFDEDHIGRSLFEVWDRTVRNAIAHATYSLDKSSLTVEFEDQGGTKEHLTIPEFITLGLKTYGVVAAVPILLVLRVFVPLILSESLKIGHS